MKILRIFVKSWRALINWMIILCPGTVQIFLSPSDERSPDSFWEERMSDELRLLSQRREVCLTVDEEQIQYGVLARARLGLAGVYF